MNHPALQDPMFQAVRRLVLESRNPSVAHAQRHLKLGYSRVVAIMEALEGDLVTAKAPDGCRRMLTGETAIRD
jgi:DNA segregation ATPase FtsK/SpoIIIE-like protein